MSFSEWKEVKLGEVIDIIGGGTPKTKMDEYWNGDIPWLSVKDFNNGNRYVYTTEKTITELGLNNSSTKLLDKDDLIISARGTVGEIAQLGRVMAFNQSCYGLKAKKDLITSSFLYYLLRHSIRDIQSNTHGSVFDTITKETFNVLKANIPSIVEQKVIADTLSCIDDKIEVNNRINKTIEEMAQAIFKSWFVDFEPFQDGEFEDSELGKIPNGWSIVSIDDVTSESNTGGDAIQKTPMVDYDTGIKCVRVGDMSNQRGIDGWGFSNVNEENFKKYQLKKNDIIVTRTATLGLNQIIDEDLNAVYNNGLIRLKLNEKVIPLFFYQTINTDKYKEYIGRIESESSTRPNMKINYLLKYKFVYPPLEVQNNFVRTISELRKQKLQLSKEIQTLTIIRDSLLPKLMSGEIRIPTEEVK